MTVMSREQWAQYLADGYNYIFIEDKKMATKAKETKFPKTIGGCADKLWQLKETRLATQKLVDEIEKQEIALRQHIIANLPKTETTGVSGKLANVALKSKKISQVEDWDAVWKYVFKTKSTDILQKRINQAAIDARIEEGKTIPGVSEFTVLTISLTKVK